MKAEENRNVSREISQFLGRYDVRAGGSEYERGLRLGLLIAKKIAEEVERNAENRPET